MKDIIHIKYFGSIRAAAQKSGEDVEFSPGVSIFSLMEQLCSLQGGALRGELFSGSELRDDVTVSLNGKIIRHEVVKEKCLEQGDTLALLPIFPGGG